LVIQRAEIKGVLWLAGMLARPAGGMALGDAKAGRVVDDDKSWPMEPNSIDLSGFAYERFHDPGKVKDRIAWLERQKGGFKPQPYDQLAQVLSQMGNERDARKVSVAKYQKLRTSGQLGRLGRIANLLFEWTVSYGYHPSLSLAWLLALLLLGSGIFYVANSRGVMVRVSTETSSEASATAQSKSSPAKRASSPKFHALLHSLDAMLPFVDLGQRKTFRISDDHPWSFWPLEAYLVVHIVAGWSLVALFAAGLSGLVRKD
jgi:hypothetical protein